MSHEPAIAEAVAEGWVLGPLFGPGRLCLDLLDCFPCWPPVEQTDLGSGDWLVIENYTTWRPAGGCRGPAARFGQ